VIEGTAEAGPLELSVILPAFNEADSLPIVWAELRAVLDVSGWVAEAIFVDDGSTDGSSDVIREICTRDPRARLVRLKQNSGLSAALVSTAENPSANAKANTRRT